MVGADAEVDGERVVCDLEGAGAVEEVAPDAVGGGVFVAGELAGEEPVEVAGDDGQGGVEVTFSGRPDESASRWKPEM